MKTSLLFTLFMFSLSIHAQTNWIKGHAVWNYEFFYPSVGGSFRIETMNDTLIQGHTCQKLKCDLHEVFTINGNGDQAHTITTSSNYIYFEQDTVWYLKDNSFYVLYDFTAQQGQVRMMEPGFENEECNDSSYLYIDSVYTGFLNGTGATFYETRDSSTNSVQHGGLVNSHFGMMSADYAPSHNFFPASGWCMLSPNDGSFYSLRCFQDDSLTYNPGNVDCEYYTYLGLNQSSLNTVSVFPNPGNESVFIESPVQISSVRVIDLAGNEVMRDSAEKKDYLLNTSKLQKGMYIIEVSGTESVQTIRFVKE